MSALAPRLTESGQLGELQAAVRARLATVRRRLRGQLLLEGLAWGFGTAVVLTFSSLVLDWYGRPDLSVRVALLLLGLMGLAFVATRRLYQPVQLKLDDLDLAELLERRQRGTGERLANVLLLPQVAEQDRSSSRAMIAAAVKADYAALESVDLHAAFDAQRQTRTWTILAALAVPMVIWLVVSPSTLSLWCRRWLGGSDIRWPQQNYLSVVGLGQDRIIRVPRGESTLLQIEAQPTFEQGRRGWHLAGRGGTLIVEGSQPPTPLVPKAVQLRMMLADGTRRTGTCTQVGDSRFRYEMPPLNDPVRVTITGGDDWLAPLTIEPIDRPTINKITLTARTPGKEEPDVVRTDDSERQLLFLTGTQLELDLRVSEHVVATRVSIAGKDTPLALTPHDMNAFRLSWELKEPVTFEFQLVSETGLESKPQFLTIGLLNDRPPRLTLRSSGVGRRITPVARIPLQCRIVDDYGLREVILEAEDTRIVDSKPVTAIKPWKTETFDGASSPGGAKLPLEFDTNPMFPVAELALTPGSGLRVRARAADACVLGSQSAESRWLAFQIVSVDELFYEILTRQREQRNRFGKAVEQAKTQAEELQRATLPAEIAALGRNQQAIARQVSQVTNQLDASLTEMTLNEVGTDAARQLLLKTIIEPLQAIQQQPFADLKQHFDTLARGERLVAERHEAAIAAQMEINQRLQRILDQMSQWESFVDVVNQLRHVITTEDQIRDGTEQMQNQQVEDVFE